jgi:hypothetical protein
MVFAGQLAEEISLNGYAVAPSHLEPDALERLRQTPHEVLATASGDAVKTSRNGGDTRAYLSDSADLRSLQGDKLLLDVAARVLRRPFTLKYFLSRTVHHSASAQALHRDCDLGTPPGSLLAFIWMIDGFERSNGATQFVPGSHRGLVASAPVLATGAAGSLIIYDRAVLHGYTANRSRSDRRSIQGGFDPVGDEAEAMKKSVSGNA